MTASGIEIMKKSSAREVVFFDGDQAEDDRQDLLPADQSSHAREDLIESEGSTPPAQDGDATNAGKLSKHRRSVKMLQENWENKNTIRSTTRALNMEVFDIVRRRAIKEIGKGDPEIETSIAMPQIIEHFIADAMAGHYSKSSYARYRTALMSEMNIQLRTLGDAGEMSEYIDAIDTLSQRINSPKTIFDSSLGIHNKKPTKKIAEKRIGRADLKIILRELEDRGEKGDGTRLWVQATMITGLRPVEWNQSELDEEGKLHTRRAKSHRHIAAFERTTMAKRIVGRDVKNVYEADEIIIKAMGEMPTATIVEHRTLELEGDELEIVRRHLGNIERESIKGEDGFDKYQRACTQYLYRVCQSIWNGEKLYSLYSFRHQFAANSKRVMSLDEVKLTLGSNSAMKYARRSQSWKGLEGAGDYHRQLETGAQEQQEADETGSEPTPRPE